MRMLRFISSSPVASYRRMPSAMRRLLTISPLLLLLATPSAQAPPLFSVEEATIADIHSALKSGRITCRALVSRYLRRIEAFDKNGPALNAIVVVNPEALNDADRL